MSVVRSSTAIPNRPLIELNQVSRRFEVKRQHQRSFQEMFIRIFRREPKIVEEFWPLRNISLAVYPGDCIGIIGPNGTGKSTLLKVVAGILSPTSGDLSVHGRISALLELGAGFHPELTGRENIYLNGSIYGLHRREMAKLIERIISYAELGDFIDTPVKHYSSGMYVRLGFAVAIHTHPDILLVDEVLAVGDATFQRKCLRSIHEFRNNGGTLVLVTHDLETVRTICNRALWIEEGNICLEGSPSDVVMAYTRSVAGKIEQSYELQDVPVDERNAQAKHEGDEALDDDTGQQPLRRWGTGAVRITSVETCLEDGTVHHTFYNGDPVCIRLSYSARQRVENPIFGLAIYHNSGTHICGPNTRFGELDLPFVEGEGTLSYRIASLALLEGEYLISAAVVNRDDSETFDFHDRHYSFSVFSGKSKERYGLVTLNGTWSIDTPV